MIAPFWSGSPKARADRGRADLAADAPERTLMQNVADPTLAGDEDVASGHNDRAEGA
jgi:hypothetical protein